jgi:hypothetical protein
VRRPTLDCRGRPHRDRRHDHRCVRRCHRHPPGRRRCRCQCLDRGRSPPPSRDASWHRCHGRRWTRARPGRRPGPPR